MPAGALHAMIVDVDGDGRRDAEWAKVLLGGSVYFGITTASGATISAEEQFAGGGGREFVAGKLSNGVVVAIPSETRASALWSFVHCTLRRVKGVYDAKATFGEHPDFWFYSAGNGGAAGCLDGRLVGFHSKPDGKGHVTIAAQQVSLSTNGRRASTGTTTVVHKHVRDTTMADFDKIERYRQISCGASKVLHPVFHPS